jgi:hypothetical protein
MSTIRNRLAGHGVSAERLAAIGMTEPAPEAEAAAAAANAQAAVKHDAEALDAYVRYVSAPNAFARSKIRETVGNDILAHGRSLLGGK